MKRGLLVIVTIVCSIGVAAQAKEEISVRAAQAKEELSARAASASDAVASAAEAAVDAVRPRGFLPER